MKTTTIPYTHDMIMSSHPVGISETNESLCNYFTSHPAVSSATYYVTSQPPETCITNKSPIESSATLQVTLQGVQLTLYMAIVTYRLLLPCIEFSYIASHLV